MKQKVFVIFGIPISFAFSHDGWWVIDKKGYKNILYFSLIKTPDLESKEFILRLIAGVFRVEILCKEN